MIDFITNNGSQLLLLTWEHLYISGIALALGILVAVPIGVLLTRYKKVASAFISAITVLQTVPSLALLALMIPLFGVGKVPAVVALFLYSLMPILRNTYIGMEGVDKDLIDAAKGMGMTNKQLIFSVELPQAAPVIMAGIRLSGVYVIAWATLASYIGGGGLGDFIFNGLNLYIPELIIGGTIPVTLLALLVDFLLGKVEEKVTPVNLRTAK
ncbi:ABC transporter permease [Desemzia sp. C1]|uniref:ABC transporter permease n=1 Tax=Desemzia sp. C1 TaxID=2892016 RepID=UPI001E568A3B|nr:ABC transporter permease [Desemzia sp. C1]MCI3029720.1 ABC transporter permease [Desemzia sp. C1]